MNASMVHMTAPALLPVSTLLAHTTAHANKKDTVIMVACALVRRACLSAHRY